MSSHIERGQAVTINTFAIFPVSVSQLNIEIYQALIKHCPLFQRLNNSQVLRLLREMYVTVLMPSDIVVAEGQPSTALYFISRGVVRVYTPPPHNDPHIRATSEPHQSHIRRTFRPTSLIAHPQHMHMQCTSSRDA